MLSNRRRFVPLMANEHFLHCDLFAEALEWISPFEFVQLSRRVLVQELINREIASTYANLDLSAFYLDCNSAGAKLIDACGFAHEHDLEFGAVREVVDVFSQFFVNDVILYRNVDGNARFKVNDVLF